LQEYLRRGPSPKVAFEIYDDVYTVDVRLAGMGQVFQLIENEMYRPSVEEILKYPLKYAQAMESIDQKLRSLGLPVSPKSGLVSFINDLTVTAKDRNMQAKLIEKIKRGQFYQNVNDSSQADIISRDYFVDIMELYAAYRAEQTNKEYWFEGAEFNLLDNLFEGLYRCRTFGEDLKDALTEIKGKYYNMVMDDLLVYVCNYSATNLIAPRIKQIMTDYLHSLPKGKIKKLTETVLEDIPEKYENRVKAFLGEKTEKGGMFGKSDKPEEKKSFWATIFGKKK
jgi:propanediol dehydratase small subunit